MPLYHVAFLSFHNVTVQADDLKSAELVAKRMVNLPNGDKLLSVTPAVTAETVRAEIGPK
jgi:hypothetical protein